MGGCPKVSKIEALFEQEQHYMCCRCILESGIEEKTWTESLFQQGTRAGIHDIVVSHIRHEILRTKTDPKYEKS